KQPKKRSLGVLNEHSETVFNEVLPTQVAFQRPVIKKTPAKAGVGGADYNKARQGTRISACPQRVSDRPGRLARRAPRPEPPILQGYTHAWPGHGTGSSARPARHRLSGDA